MPTYEYACKSCGQHVEVVQSFKDDSLTTCAVCGGPLRKVFGSIGIAFKGSGFYRNDSRTTTASSSDRGSSDKGSADKGSADKGSSDKSGSEKSSEKTPSSSSSSSETKSSSDSSKGDSKRASSSAS